MWILNVIRYSLLPHYAVHSDGLARRALVRWSFYWKCGSVAWSSTYGTSVHNPLLTNYPAVFNGDYGAVTTIHVSANANSASVDISRGRITGTLPQCPPVQNPWPSPAPGGPPRNWPPFFVSFVGPGDTAYNVLASTNCVNWVAQGSGTSDGYGQFTFGMDLSTNSLPNVNDKFFISVRPQ